MDFDFRPAPFWFLNHRFEKDELLRQIALMSKSGVSGFFIHPRAGNHYQTYGSKEWFDTVKFIVSEAEKVGLKAWLYDEDPFPSGAAGGRVAFENPEFIARRLVVKKIPCNKDTLVAKANLGKCKVLSAYAIKQSGGNIIDIIDVSDSVGTVREKYFYIEIDAAYYCDMKNLSYPHPRAEAFCPQMRFQAVLPDTDYTVYIATAEICLSPGKYGFLPDCINDKCTDLFIELTHEKYRSAMGAYFGNVIPGIFLDESKPGGQIPWTNDIEKVFKVKYGYSARENYYHFADTFSDFSRKFRLDYLTAVNDLMDKRFYKKLSNWHKKNNLLLTGHIIAEEDLVSQSMNGENVYRSLKHFDIPGFDIVGSNLGDNDHFSLTVGAKTVSSAAHQQGKRIVLSEAFACNPYNFGIEGLKRQINWLFAVGITWLVPHGFYYSYDGMRKSDAGTSFFFQHPEFDKIKGLFERAGSIGKQLAQSNRICNTCVIQPIEQLTELAYAEIDSAKSLRGLFFDTLKTLTNNHIEWDIVDSAAVYKGKISNGVLKVGLAKYNSVIVIDGGINSPSVSKIIAYLKEREINTLISQEGGFSVLELKARAVSVDIKEIEGDCKNIMSLYKKQKCGELIYLFNNSLNSVLFSVHYNKKVVVTDVWTGESFLPQIENERASLYLEGYQAVLLQNADSSIQPGKTFPNTYIRAKKEYAYNLKPEWNYNPADCKVIGKIISWDVCIGFNNSTQVYKDVKFSQVRAYHGTTLSYISDLYVRPGFDTARSYKLYPVKAEYTAKINLPKGEYKLLFEGETFLGDYTLYINGKKIEIDDIILQPVYDFTNKVINILQQNDGILELKVFYESANEFDGINSIIYVISAN